MLNKKESKEYLWNYSEHLLQLESTMIPVLMQIPGGEEESVLPIPIPVPVISLILLLIIREAGAFLLL